MYQIKVWADSFPEVIYETYRNPNPDNAMYWAEMYAQEQHSDYEDDNPDISALYPETVFVLIGDKTYSFDVEAEVIVTFTATETLTEVEDV